MKSLKDYILITEHFVNIFTADKIRPYTKEAWEMISKAYEYIGGVAGCPDYETFVKFYCDNADKEKFMWKIVTRNKHISALKIYTMKRGGRKGIILASNGTDQGKKDLTKILEEDYNLSSRKNWDELSGKALGSALKNGAVPLPNDIIVDLMPDKKIERLDDGWFYRRKLGSEIHTKLLVGYPPFRDHVEAPDEETIKHIKELSRKYEEEDKKINNRS